MVLGYLRKAQPKDGRIGNTLISPKRYHCEYCEGQPTISQRLELDEIALRKGHRDFVVIVTARKDDRISILGVLADQEKDTVIEFLRSIPERLKKTITTALKSTSQSRQPKLKSPIGLLQLQKADYAISIVSSISLAVGGMKS